MLLLFSAQEMFCFDQTVVYKIFKDCKEDELNAFQNQRAPKMFPKCFAGCIMSGRIGQMRAFDGTPCASGNSQWMGASYVSFGNYDLISMDSVRHWDHSFINLQAALDSFPKK